MTHQVGAESTGPGRRFLIVHGLGNHRPSGHWQFWLTEQLRRRGEQVIYPQFPDPTNPDLDRWLKQLACEYSQLGQEQRIVVCHSLACALWYRASERGVLSRPADRVLLVAPPGPAVLARSVTAAFNPGRWETVVLHSSSMAIPRLVASDADPFCAEGPAATIYGKPLELDSETLPGAGHLSTADGYGRWPKMLQWCLNPEARFIESTAGEADDL